jgi:hypothetical protein
MKKFLTIAAVAFAAFATISCDKSNSEGEENTEVKRVVAMATDADFKGGYTFTYNEDGSLASVNEVWDVGTEWEGSYACPITIEGKEIAFGEEATGTLGTNGFVTTLVKGDKTWTIAYNKDNQITSMTAGEEVITNEYNAKGNLVKFTTPSGRYKEQVYDERATNWSNTFTIFYEDGPIKRWMYETGYFGKSSKNLCSSTKWNDSEVAKTYEYKMDDMGYITEETMYYEGAFDWAYYYKWETVKK